MKNKLLIIAALFVGIAAYAQPRAVGIRIGAGISASYQHTVGNDNMVSLDVDFPMFNGGISTAATYDWVFGINSWNNKGSWNWYAGVGAGIGMRWPNVNRQDYGNITSKVSAGYMNIGVAGRIGVEYNFWFPLQLSLDCRPVIGPEIYWNNTVTTTNGHTVRDNNTGVGFSTKGIYAGAISLGIRYKF